MDHEQQLELQAYVDGELSTEQAGKIEGILARDSEARRCLESIKSIRDALKDAELERKLPESREFFWSKIQHQIEPAAPKPRRDSNPSFISRFRRFLNPAGAVAALALIFFVAMLGQFGIGWQGTEVESSMADSGALTYMDYPNRTTLVWLSYPPDSDYE